MLRRGSAANERHTQALTLHRLCLPCRQSVRPGTTWITEHANKQLFVAAGNTVEQRDGKSVLNFPDATRIRDRYKTDWHRNTVKHQKTHKLFAFDCHLGYFETYAFINLLPTNSLLSLISNTNLLHGQIPVSLFLPFCKPPSPPLPALNFHVN